QQILECWFLERFTCKTPREILTMLQNLTPLEETLAYKTIFAEGEIKGRAEGEAYGVIKGKEEGKIEGKIIGEAALLKRQLIRKFNKLPKWAQQRIDKADATQLEIWGERIFDAQNLKQLLDDVD
ncbi:hypothetical protein TI03_04980, partial [Achromatium sp. WMS1]